MIPGTRSFNPLGNRPSWSADGSRFVAEKDAQSYIVSRDLSKQQRLGPSWGHTVTPAFSPDGASIACSVYDVPQGESLPTWQLHITDSQGHNHRLASPDTGWDATWAPDGSKLAFINASGPRYHLSVVNADGSSQHDIQADWVVERPAFTPDGSQLVYAKGTSERHLFVTKVDGSGTHELKTFRGTRHDSGPVVSPDGKSAVFEHFSTDSDQIDLAVVPLDGRSGATRITTLPGKELDATWSPDGSQIAFCSDKEGCFDLYVMDADGSHLRQVTDTLLKQEYAPSWSPDGRSLAFLTVGLDGHGGYGVVDLADASPPSSGT